MLMILVAGLASFAPSGRASAEQIGESIQTTGGLVQGFRHGAVAEYMNIPFAGPTGGDARFLPAPPLARWGDVRAETKSGPMCEQQGLGPLPAGKNQSEDCLSIDIYAPVDAVGRRLPVIVWLYGGAFVIGSNSQYSVDSWVADNDVILAIPNYRSGVFGFLALPELVKNAGGAVGNAGLLDQQAALRWVRDNIAGFGGDPGNVTLAGESAGAISVCAQLVSPAARGLFSKAIIESGICGHNSNTFASTAEAERRAENYALEMNCGDATTRLRCLQSLPAATLLASPTNELKTMKLTWSPTRDGVVIPAEFPDVAIARGSAPNVPIMMGTNKHEGTTFIALTDFAQLEKPSPESYAAFVQKMFGPSGGAILSEYPVERFAGSAVSAQVAVITDGMLRVPRFSPRVPSRTVGMVTPSGNTNSIRDSLVVKAHGWAEGRTQASSHTSSRRPTGYPVSCSGRRRGCRGKCSTSGPGLLIRVTRTVKVCLTGRTGTQTHRRTWNWHSTQVPLRRSSLTNTTAVSGTVYLVSRADQNRTWSPHRRRRSGADPRTSSCSRS